MKENLPGYYYSSMMYSIHRNEGVVCQGTIVTGKPPKKVRHAWVEFEETVWDPYLRGEVEKALYYKVFKASTTNK